MKKIFLAIFFALTFFNFFAQAQDQNSKEPQWQNFNPPLEEFSVEFPQAVTSRSFGDGKRAPHSGFYSALFYKTYFFVRSEWLRGDREISEKIINYITSQQVVRNSSVNIGGHDALVYTFLDEDGFYNRVLAINTKRRAYFFHTLSETENNVNVNHFFDSINFPDGKNVKSDDGGQTQPSLPRNSLPPDRTDRISVPVPIPPPDVNLEKGTVVGTNTGSGVGSGRSGNWNDSKTETTQPQTNSLKILSKPRAEYTDLARLYLISGKVRVRITFLENGQIGEVTPGTRLPFGLTRNAVEAARQIRFEPAIKDGKPHTVTRIVEYSFSIF